MRAPEGARATEGVLRRESTLAPGIALTLEVHLTLKAYLPLKRISASKAMTSHSPSSIVAALRPGVHGIPMLLLGVFREPTLQHTVFVSICIMISTIVYVLPLAVVSMFSDVVVMFDFLSCIDLSKPLLVASLPRRRCVGSLPRHRTVGDLGKAGMVWALMFNGPATVVDV